MVVQFRDAFSQCFPELIARTGLGLERSAAADHSVMCSLFWSRGRRPWNILGGVFDVENKVCKDTVQRYELEKTLYNYTNHCKKA